MAALAICGSCAALRAQVFIPLDLSAVVNEPWTDVTAGHAYPKGAQTLGGVPFDIANTGTGLNFWGSLGSTSGILELPVDVFGVQRVYFLLNTAWGIGGANTAEITFTGSAGASYSVTLVGNVDIRDHFNGGFTGSLGGIIATNVFSDPAGVRLDRQQITLPGEFTSQTLTSIRITDLIHSSGASALIFSGATVEAVPEPGTFALLATGLLALVWCRRRG